MSQYSECFDYGSTRGCSETCPVLLRGECEIQYENEKKLGMDHIPLSGGYACPECKIKLNASALNDRKSMRCQNCKRAVMIRISAMEFAP